MATLALSLAGQFAGGLVGGPIGATIGRALGALAGSAIDSALFGEKEQSRALPEFRLRLDRADRASCAYIRPISEHETPCRTLRRPHACNRPRYP